LDEEGRQVVSGVLAALEPTDVTLAAAVLGFCWLIVQFFDRLYGSKKREEDASRRITLAQSTECGLQHSQIAAQMIRAHELLNEQTKAQLELTKAVASLVAATEKQSMVASYNHKELLQLLRAREDGE
jgi:hypothetical protein